MDPEALGFDNEGSKCTVHKGEGELPTARIVSPMIANDDCDEEKTTIVVRTQIERRETKIIQAFLSGGSPMMKAGSQCIDAGVDITNPPPLVTAHFTNFTAHVTKFYSSSH
jgi:hypothetical protein